MRNRTIDVEFHSNGKRYAYKHDTAEAGDFVEITNQYGTRFCLVRSVGKSKKATKTAGRIAKMSDLVYAFGLRKANEVFQHRPKQSKKKSIWTRISEIKWI